MCQIIRTTKLLAQEMQNSLLRYAQVAIKLSRSDQALANFNIAFKISRPPT